MFNNTNSTNPHNVDNNSPYRMKKDTVKIVTVVIVAILSLLIVIGGCLGCYFAGRNAERLSNFKDDLAIANEVYSLIKEYYYQDISKEDFNKWAAIGLSSTMDKYSGLSYTSVIPALQFGISIKSDSYNNHIISAISHSADTSKPTPAESAKGLISGQSSPVSLERGDILVSVGGKSVEGLTTDALNGEEFFGKATLTDAIDLVVRKSNGKEAHFTLRKSLFLTKEASYKDMGNGIGYIKLNSFTGSADEDFVECAELFKRNGNSRLILDLRDNGGGSTNILSVIASYLIHNDEGNSNGLGVIKLKSNKTQKVTTYTATGNNWLGLDSAGKKIPNYKLAVLINENSASASEALLGAIKYYCPEATIIGSPTYGKGIAQQTFDLTTTKEYVLSMTVGYFYVPVGANNWETFHGRSIMPSSDKYTIGKFADLIDFTAEDENNIKLYTKYYNNDLTKEAAVEMAMSVLA